MGRSSKAIFGAGHSLAQPGASPTSTCAATKMQPWLRLNARLKPIQTTAVCFMSGTIFGSA